jgi:hypothetical protein
MRKPWKYGMLGALIVIAVLYGIELTSQGLADVYGPLDRGQSAPVPAQTEVQGEQTGQVTGEPVERQPVITQVGGGKVQAADEPGPIDGTDTGAMPTVPAASGESSVNRLADGTAGLLQSVSSGGIRFVVSMFEAITD